MICYDHDTSKVFPHIVSVEHVYCLGQILSRQNKTKKTQKDLKIKDASVLSRSHKLVTLSTDTGLSGDLQKGLDGDNNMGRNKVSWADNTYGHEPRNWSSLVKMYGDSDTTEVWDPENDNAKQVFRGSTNKDNNDSKRIKKKSYSPTLEEDVNMYGDTGTKSKSPKRSFNPMQTSYEDNEHPKRHILSNNFRPDRKKSYSPSRKDALLNCDQNCCKCIKKNVKLNTQPKNQAEPLDKSSKQNKAKGMQENIKFEVKPREECDPDACGELYRQYQTKNICNHNDKDQIEAPAKAKKKKKLKQNNRATLLNPEIEIDYPYKDIDTCPEGLCVDAAMKKKTDFNCKCSRIPAFPKECTDFTCRVSPMTTSMIPTESLSSSNTLSSKTLVTIGKIKCLCHKYSQKITSRRRRGSTKIKNIMVVPEEPAKRNICDNGICHAADQKNINDFTCKCTVVKECTDETCNVKKQKDMKIHENNNTKKTKELQTKKKKLKGKRNIAPTAGEGDKLRNDNKIKKQDNDIINQGDQSGEPFFEMKINYNNMCVLNPDEVNDKVKSMKEILRKTCVCPSHKRRRRHYLLDTTCRAGPCLKAYKNKRTNFTCTCSKPHTECFDSTCKEHSQAKNASIQESLKEYSNKHDEPLMDILVNPRNMCVVNKDHIFDTLKSIQKEKREPCSIGICKDKENKAFKCLRKQNSFICNCLNKNKKEEIMSCSEPTCSKKKRNKSPINSKEPVDYIMEQQTPMVEQPVALTPSNFLSYCRLRCLERSQRRQAERESIKKGALLCKDKICARPGTYHSRDGIKITLKKNEMHEMKLCNCKECNKKRKKIKEKPKYQCGDMICHDTILKLPGAKKAGYERRQVKLYGGSTGDGCKCCVCGKGPAECTCTCLSKILHARKYVCASISTLINTINTLRGRPPPLPENNKKGNIKHTCECHKEMQKLKKKPKKKPKPKKVKKKEKIIKKKKKVNDNTAKRKQLMNEDRELKKSERKERRRAEKKERKLRKQQLKDLQALVQGKEESQDTNCCADFIVGIFKIGFNIVKTTVQIIFIAIFNPKGAYRYARLRIMDPSGTVIRIKKWFMDFVYLKKMEMAKTMSGSHTMIVLSDTFKDSVFYKAFSSKGRTKEERQKLEMESKQRSKRVRRRHDEAIYSCRHTLLTTLRKTPCLWVYHICPTLYPQCLSLLGFMRSFADIMLFCAALIVWTPCIACCELCRACMCCTVCTG